MPSIEIAGQMIFDLRRCTCEPVKEACRHYRIVYMAEEMVLVRKRSRRMWVLYWADDNLQVAWTYWCYAHGCRRPRMLRPHVLAIESGPPCFRQPDSIHGAQVVAAGPMG
jgi:hypothetical protein